jgi:hypothetical protein
VLATIILGQAGTDVYLDGTESIEYFGHLGSLFLFDSTAVQGELDEFGGAIG